jgi:DNA-binding NarL/FixJ family response regulator
MANVAKVLLVDDDPASCEAWVRLVSGAAGFSLCHCAEGRDAAGLLEALEREAPDAVVVNMPRDPRTIGKWVRAIRALRRRAALLVIADHDDLMLTELALRAGARGVLLRSEAQEWALEALWRILGGEIYVGQKLGSGLVKSLLDRHAPDRSGQTTEAMDLSPREAEVLHLLGHGCRTRGIALELDLSEKTVAAHQRRIRKKLKIRDAEGLRTFAANWATHLRKD